MQSEFPGLARASTTAARHSSASAEHYSPLDIVEPGRVVLGEIDLDPASCALANTIIKAKAFFTREDDGFPRQWQERVWLNPPGGLCDVEVDPPDGLPLPHEFPMCFPARRVPYLRACDPNPTLSLFGHEPALEEGDAPPHASVLVYLPPRGDIEALCWFARAFEPLGALVGPWPAGPVPDIAAWSLQRRGRLCPAWWFTTPGELIVDVLRRAGPRGLHEADIRSAVVGRVGKDDGEDFDASLQDLRDCGEVAMFCEATGPGRLVLADRRIV